MANAAKLINVITDGEKVNIINFNYTNPFIVSSSDAARSMINSNMVTQVSNVHGNLADDNIIFGVDLTEDLPLDAHIFAKTHRKMLQDSSSNSLPKGVNRIKFYGHSLGKADYSYFQSIFDHYNLYGDNLDLLHYRSGDKPVVLRFYFTVYDESKEAEIRRSATDSVYKLIVAYGDTLDNKDKGKNLLHKLLLEGRVQIEFLCNIET